MDHNVFDFHTIHSKFHSSKFILQPTIFTSTSTDYSSKEHLQVSIATGSIKLLSTQRAVAAAEEPVAVTALTLTRYLGRRGMTWLGPIPSCPVPSITGGPSS